MLRLEPSPDASAAPEFNQERTDGKGKLLFFFLKKNTHKIILLI